MTEEVAPGFGEADIRALAAELEQAERSHVQIRQFSRRFPGMSIADGYRISRAWMDLKVAAGRTVVGHKIGLTSRAMQLSAGITEPDYGTLLDDMVMGDAGEVPFDRFIMPKVEVELAFVLARPLRGPGVSVTDVLAATAYVMPAVEIIDSRVHVVDPDTGTGRRIQDTISDNAACAAIVPGGLAVAPDRFDLRWTGAMVSRNAVIEETGLAAGVLNHPARGVAWLANKLAPWGQELDPGEIVLGGSFTRPVEAARGDVFHIDYGPLGAFGLRFV